MNMAYDSVMRGKVNCVTFGFMESIFKASHLFNLFFLFFFIFSFVNSVAADVPVGKLAIVRGKVTVRKAGAEKRTVAGAGHCDVFVGDILQTEKDSMSQVVFTDDSFINMSSATALMIKQYIYEPENNSALANKGCNGCYDRRKAIIKVLAGKARFIIYKQRNRESSFNVETNSASVKAVIADFGVAVLPDETEVAVLDGVVTVKNISLLTVGKIRLRINQKAVVREKAPPSKPSIITPQQRRMYIKDVYNF